MSQSLFQITIPEPCHEDWERMQADARGKFCRTCNKSVYDFSQKTPAEIRGILLQQSPGKICGYFKETQLNRPLSDMPDKRLVNFTRRFAFAVYLVFGSLLFSCKTIPEPDQKPQVEWVDGPVFQKGRFITHDPEIDSTRRIYGKADYMKYLPEEVIDSTMQRSE